MLDAGAAGDAKVLAVLGFEEAGARTVDSVAFAAGSGVDVGS